MSKGFRKKKSFFINTVVNSGGNITSGDLWSLLPFYTKTKLNLSLQVSAKSKILCYFVVICLWKEGWPLQCPCGLQFKVVRARNQPQKNVGSIFKFDLPHYVAVRDGKLFLFLVPVLRQMLRGSKKWCQTSSLYSTTFVRLTKGMLNKDLPTWCHLFYYFTIYCSTCFEC